MNFSNKHNRIQEHGFSLIELVVVIALIAIVSTLATISFNQWSNKSAAETQVKQMLSDIGELRIRSITSKQPSSVYLYPNSYVMKAYTSVFTPYSSVLQQKILPNGTRTVKFPLNKDTGSSYNGEYFEINERGINVSSVYTIYLGGDATNGALNCLTVHTVRVNVGKNTGTATSGVCNDR
jgi:prepilin-type N-terminal cleavage/methylation domain-containing protein